MSFYIDTSALVSALTSEPATPRVNAWLRAQAPGTVFISEWTHTEIASALALKLRTREITLQIRADALATITELASSSLPTLAVTSEHFETAAGFAGQHVLGLRAGDSLHLAIAQAVGHTLVTLDTRMAEAALQFGIPVEPV